jgi:alpha,alpha-trehalase
MSVVVSPIRYDAVILDMDGVVTDTAALHLRAWRQLFDEVLASHGDRAADERPFSDEDYRHYIDGRARYDGAAAFLASRGQSFPRGAPSDDETVLSDAGPTVCGLGNRKDRYFHDLLRGHGAVAFPGTVSFLRACRRVGLGTAVVSASRSCAAVLAAAGVAGLFDVRVDGVTAEQESLPGKPDPAIFLAAAARLGVLPGRAVVVEDAEAGVAAGRAGGFGLVVGVDRTGHANELAAHGADAVVSDLDEVSVLEPSARPEVAR